MFLWGAGLVCPQDEVKKLTEEIEKAVKENKAEAKKIIDARAKELKIEMLPKEERINNRKILMSEAIGRINNFADSCAIVDYDEKIKNSKDDNIIELIEGLLSAINWVYRERSSEVYIKEVYDDNIKIINDLKNEILEIL